MFQLDEVTDQTFVMTIVYRMPSGGSITQTYDVEFGLTLVDYIKKYLNQDHARLSHNVEIKYANFHWSVEWSWISLHV